MGRVMLNDVELSLLHHKLCLYRADLLFIEVATALHSQHLMNCQVERPFVEAKAERFRRDDPQTPQPNHDPTTKHESLCEGESGTWCTITCCNHPCVL